MYYLNSPFESSTLVELLCQRALQQPESRTYTFLADGELEEAHFTYADLDRRARAIGSLLQQRLERGSRALLVYPSGLEFIATFFGCLYAGVIAVPTYPPQTRTKRSLAKLQSIINDVQPSVILTVSSLSSTVESLFAQFQDLQGIRLVTTDTIGDSMAAEWRDPHVDSDTLAFLQYTSGSTGMPKGVMLTHGNLLHNLDIICKFFEVEPGIRTVSWLPPYHDMGLIGIILGTVFADSQTTIMSPVAFLQRPVRWLQAISKTRAIISGGPNFAYDLCVRKITPEQKATLDLSSWKLAINGAEPIRQETLERFIEAFAPCGFSREALYPCYGLAEATLLAAGGRRAEAPIIRTFQAAALEQNQVVMVKEGALIDNESSRRLVGSGQAPSNQKIIIVDPESLTQCLPDRIGEIWLAGPSIAQGYWQKPEETRHIFQAYLADSGEGPFLRSGDLGFLQDGELFVTGRLKDLIIIRGRNHYPQDIELTVERSHPALRPGNGVAFSVDVLSEERLVIMQEVDRQYRNLNVDEVVVAIRQAVAEQHELQVYAILLIKMGSIPKTSSGKLQRRACREAFLAHSLDAVGEWTLQLEDSHLEAALVDDAFLEESMLESTQVKSTGAIQAWLVSHISEHLGVDASNIDVREPLAHYGLDSVQAVNLSENLSAWLGRQLSPTLAYDYPTIEALAWHLAAATGTDQDIVAANGRQIREELLLAEPGERQALLENYIREKVARMMRLSPSLLDIRQPLGSLGLDSLMAIELKNAIEVELKVQVPITTFLQEPGIAEFTAQLLDQLTTTVATPSISSLLIDAPGGDRLNAVNGDGISQQDAEQLLAQLDQLTNEEVDALLSQVSKEEVGQIDATNGNAINQQDAEQLLAQLDQLTNEEVDALLSQISPKEPT